MARRLWGWLLGASGASLLSLGLLHNASPMGPAHSETSSQATSNANALNCGVECLCFLDKYYGGSASIDEVRNLGGHYVADDRLTLEDMQRMSRDIGLPPMIPATLDIDDLNGLSMPCVLHFVRGGVPHYVVCLRASDNYVQFIDLLAPTEPIKTIPKSTFRQWFKGYALILAR